MKRKISDEEMSSTIPDSRLRMKTLTQSEKKAGFCALWSEPSQVISVNSAHGLKDCMKRDTEFLKWYMGEKKGGDNAE